MASISASVVIFRLEADAFFLAGLGSALEVPLERAGTGLGAKIPACWSHRSISRVVPSTVTV